MADISIQQAMLWRGGDGQSRLLGRSPGFLDDWIVEIERLATGFGARPSGVACPECVFAQAIAKQLVAIAQVSGPEGTETSALVFRFLVLDRRDYRDQIGDPFVLADRFPAPWHLRGELPVLPWSADSVKHRSVEEVRAVLQRADGPILLGGAQALVDGARLYFVRPAPDPDLIRGLWLLLPTSTRRELWPASFAFSVELGFHAIALPATQGLNLAGYLDENQAGDYPEGRYELNLQIAAESNDQAALNALFARRSRSETMRLGLILVAVFLVLAIVFRLVQFFR